MEVFSIPIIMIPEDRKTIRAWISERQCLIRFPALWIKRKKYLAMMVDRVYWQLLAHQQAGELANRTAELNQFFFQFDYSRVRYHRQFRRWGSCSVLKNINLSHRLIGAPRKLEDYVIIHELAHLRYLNHGKEFWNLMAITGFNPESIRKEIQLYGRSWQNDYYQWYHKILTEL